MLGLDDTRCFRHCRLLNYEHKELLLPVNDGWNDEIKSERKSDGNGKSNENGDELRPLAVAPKNYEDEPRLSNSVSFPLQKAPPPHSRRGQGEGPKRRSIPEN